MHMNAVLTTLCKSTEKDLLQWLTCDNPLCLERFHQYVKLYMTVRIHHALKMSIIGKTYSQERNRKFLKLCHD